MNDIEDFFDWCSDLDRPAWVVVLVILAFAGTCLALAFLIILACAYFGSPFPLFLLLAAIIATLWGLYKNDTND